VYMRLILWLICEGEDCLSLLSIALIFGNYFPSECRMIDSNSVLQCKRELWLGTNYNLAYLPSFLIVFLNTELFLSVTRRRYLYFLCRLGGSLSG
jgi:hypothetical protein